MPKLLIAALSTLVCGLYIAANVHWNYDGNATGLFYTGAQTRLPAELEAEPTRRVPEVVGYDGQFYHLALHNPLLRRGYSGYADNTRLRWRRIGVPGAAAALHAITGTDPHWLYVAVQLGFVFLGTWWLATWSEHFSLPGWVGFGFVLIPAVLVSIDRMTVDLPLAALTIGFAVYARRPGWPLYVILCVAPLVRETGMLLVGGVGASLLLERRWTTALFTALCGLPALAWWTYVRSHSHEDATDWIARFPFSGILDRISAGESTPTTTLWMKAAWATEHLAFAGICLAIFCTGLLIARKQFGPVEITAVLFAAFASLLGRADIWNSAYATGRTMSPLLILLALIGLRDRRAWFVVPILLILPRIALQYQAQITFAFRVAMRPD